MTSFWHQETWMAKYILSRPHFQGKLLHEITRAEWKEVFGPHGTLVKEHGLSSATHNRVRAMAHKMYEDARREFEPPRATENPIHDIGPLEETKKAPQILADQAQIRAYIEAAYKDPHFACWGIYVAIKLNTGLRQQNIMPLRWKDWMESDSTLQIREKFVRTKGFFGFQKGTKADGDERMVGVNKTLKEALEGWRRATQHPEPEDFIVAREDGKYLIPHQIWEANFRTCAAAKIPYLSEHKLRHSYATHYLAAGGNIHDLKQNLFHASVTTTEIYSHALKSELGRRAEVFQAGTTGAKKEESK